MPATHPPQVTDHLEHVQRRLEADRALPSASAAPADIRAHRFLGPMVGVVDHARRVLLPAASAHYRCDKTGPLLADAVAAQTAAFLDYVGEDQYDAVKEIEERLEAAVAQAREALWGLGR